MKNWNEIFEHHDTEWPQELLSMTVDQLLDKLKDMQLQSEYDTIEDILKMHFMEGEDSHSDEMPTFDEIADRESNDFDSMMGKDSWMDLDF
jgi:flagellar motor switch protein FliM